MRIFAGSSLIIVPNHCFITFDKIVPSIIPFNETDVQQTYDRRWRSYQSIGTSGNILIEKQRIGTLSVSIQCIDGIHEGEFQWNWLLPRTAELQVQFPCRCTRAALPYHPDISLSASQYANLEDPAS